MHIAFYSILSSHDYRRRKMFKYNKTVYEIFYHLRVRVAITFGRMCVKCKETHESIAFTDLNTGR